MTLTADRALRRASAIVLVLALLTGCDPPGPGDPHDGGAASATAGEGPTTAAVRRGDLTAVVQHGGQLGFGETRPLVAASEGIVTVVPAPGSVVTLGQALIEVSGRATHLLHGARPAWRPQAVSDRAADEGPDHHQLNDNLAVMGYAPREDLPEWRFDWRTRDAVRRWQADLGRRSTGVVELGDVAYLPGDVRVASTEVRPGARVAAGDVLLTLTGIDRVVAVDLPVTDRPLVADGTPVSIVLADGTAVEAAVESVGQVARVVEEGARPSVSVQIAVPPALADAAGLDAAPVQVQIRRVLAADALTVPVGALVALTGQGYAVERVTAGGTELVAVQPGEFADGRVAITGPVEEGDEVVVPS